MGRLKTTLLTAALFLLAFTAHACFGTLLKVGVEAERAKSVAAYSLGFFVTEKTGIEPDFTATADPVADLSRGVVDVALVAKGAGGAKGLVRRYAGKIPGLGEMDFLLREDALEDIRFTTLEKALGLMPSFYGLEGYVRALNSSAEPKKAARKAVNDGT